MIRVENLKKIYEQGTVALAELSLEFARGEFIALLGPSGCGKSTTLHCLAGLIEPTEGRIYFDDKDVTNLPSKERNIGMVFQSYALYPHMKVIDNIAFPLKQMRMGKKERYAKSKEYAELLQIDHLLERKPAQLSGGQQQRVAMARALVKEPQILLLDEPMSNLDARLRIEVREEIRRVQQALNLTAVIVTHDQEEAMSIADKIAILDKGYIQQYGTPFALYNEPANLFVAKFLGNPPMSFLHVDYDEESHSLQCQNREKFFLPQNIASVDLRGKGLILGVRSHQIGMSLEQDEQNPRLSLYLKYLENVGKELLVHGLIGEEKVRLSIPQPSRSFILEMQQKMNSQKAIYISFQQYHLFDLSSGERILTVD